MDSKRIAQIKIILGKNLSFEAIGLPESSLCIILAFFLIIIGVGWFLTSYLQGFL
jgi:hypothetical protein